MSHWIAKYNKDVSIKVTFQVISTKTLSTSSEILIFQNLLFVVIHIINAPAHKYFRTEFFLKSLKIIYFKSVLHEKNVANNIYQLYYKKIF